jgi:PERQ amino acid-rich with GYF domain-containing protein
MRWVYLDPQAKIQGPFTGLEMNDWYKANFFTPDLRVRKVEDPDFEPLGQLIRRIGNSREPFLVPQIGVAHGPAPQSGPFAPTNSGVVPPLSGVFPSFGRTLTAEEQNNLERRKQEEQYLMAQQRDFIMRQQAMSKFQIPGQGLQHHSSAHSLQSQPSFGSMTSPGGLPQHQQQPIGAMPGAAGFFDTALAQAPGATNASGNMDPFSHDELANLSMGERQMLANLQDNGGDAQKQGEHGEGAGLRSGLPGTEQLGEDPEGFRERLKQFEDLRAQHDAEQLAQAEHAQESIETEGANRNETEESRAKPTPNSKAAKAAKKKAMDEASLSLTQQVQQAQAAAAAAAHQVEEPDMPMPFPPPSSSTPLPAPMAQRVRSNLPEQYSRSQSGTPDTNAAAQPPPLAPWAKEPTEAQRGPSLKEIQEAEARKAAKAEEAAAALRRAAMEQEVASLREREKAAAAAAGLPASSTWAHDSPVSPASPWTKPGAVKGPAPGLPPATAANKKTLADIQREEELRKQKAAARETPVAVVTPTLAAKSYANLAGKPGQPLPNAATAATANVSAGWSTVGAGGKVKIPTGPSAQARAVSSPSVKPVTAASPIKPVSKPVSVSVKPNESLAMDEFNKWVHRELSRGITGVNDSKRNSYYTVSPLV